MSTEKKGGGDDAFGQDIDFGGFGGDSKSGPEFEPDIDLSIDEAPVQGKPSRPAGKPVVAEDAFGGFGGEDDKPSMDDIGGAPTSRSLSATDFGGDDEPEAPRPSARQEHEKVSFGGDEDEDEDRDDDRRVTAARSSDDEHEEGDREDGDDEHEGDEDEGEEEGEGAATDKKARLIQLATYAGIGVGALALVYFSFTQVIQPYIGPLIGLNGPAAVQVSAPTPVGQQFGQRPAQQQGQLPPLPPMQSAQPSGGTPSLPPPSLPAATSLPAPVPQVAPAAAKPDAATIDRINRLEEQLRAVTSSRSELEQRAKGLEDRLGALEARGVSQMPKPATEVPLKPEVLPGWALRGVSRGVAWVQAPSGSTLQVKAGDVLPDNGGIVKQVSKYEKDFIVITDRGVIVQR